MRQARESVTSVQEMINRLPQGVSDPDVMSIIQSAASEASVLIKQSKELRLKTIDESPYMTSAEDSFAEFLNALGSVSESKTHQLIASQYLSEALDAISKSQIRTTGDATAEFEKISRNRFRPMTVGLVIAGVFLILILAIGFTASRRINRSVQGLIQATKEVGEGNFDFHPPKVEADEIGYLAHAFQKMTDSLQETTVTRNYVVSIIDSMRDAVLFLESDGRIRRCNRRTPELIGYTNDELVGESLVKLFPGGVSVFSDLTDSEADCKTKSGEMLSVSVSISPIAERMRSQSGYVCVIADITERKRNEASIRSQNLALANANRELEAFSYSVSHDLRAPLRALDGFSHALLEDFGSTLNTEAKRYLDRIRTASQTMGKLIDDLLNLSRLSRAEMRVAAVDVTAMAKSIVANLQEREPTRNVNIKIEGGLATKADSALLNVVLTNLLDNAWKYTSKMPTAEIEVGKTEVKGKETFFVRDNGAGFNMEYSKKLFGAFQRLHTTSEFPGTGVGLATVLRIIRR
ncbi:MAG: ATP-binding protein, partial [Bdellovibrionota bacterium]